MLPSVALFLGSGLYILDDYIVLHVSEVAILDDFLVCLAKHGSGFFSLRVSMIGEEVGAARCTLVQFSRIWTRSGIKAVRLASSESWPAPTDLCLGEKEPDLCYRYLLNFHW